MTCFIATKIIYFIITETMSINKQEFWKIVMHFVKENKSSGSIPPPLIKDENNETIMHVTDQDKVECFNDYFSSISTVPDTHPILPNLISKTDAKLDQIVIHEPEVIDMLETLNV